jgi:asparagine synthase (glutamine-hydrolysing)
MCGITGFISSELTKSHLIKMTEAIKHRGPDAEGYFYDEDLHVGLGHRRLSILDLSVDANQPMTSHGKRYIMVYNGEVYNYKEIATQLGLSLNTSSDSEVILEAFVKWGDEFVQQLNGMFAIAIYDLQEKQLKLFRDRLGIKPLYYFFQDNCFAFASEIKSLHHLGIKFNINHQAVANYFYIGYPPQNSTVFKEIQQLPAGSIGTLENGAFQVSTYWDLESKIEPFTHDNYE